MRVALLTHTPLPEKNVASAAKLCYSSSSIETLRDNLTEEKTAGFVQMLAEIGHESPIEHASFTFGIEGVSRSLLAQITRHRMASFSVQSQRYVKEDQFEFIVPPEIEKDEQAKEIYIANMQRAQQDYDRLADRLSERYRREFAEQGMEEKEARRKAEKKAIEDARYVLPNACATKMILTMNARSLLNFFSHRCCHRAQWEIQQLATEMFKLVYEVAPHIFAKAGPPCTRGACPEGKMSCGRAKEMRAEFAAIKGESWEK